MGKKSKTKGSTFERFVCKSLSKWLSRGLRDDLLWRSAMSGGRASVRFKQGAKNIAQVGDISAIDPWGDRLTRVALLECKNYRNIRLDSLLRGCTAKSPQDCLAGMWFRCKADAARVSRVPVLIFRQGRLGDYVVLNMPGAVLFNMQPAGASVIIPDANAYIFTFAQFLKLARRPT